MPDDRRCSCHCIWRDPENRRTYRCEIYVLRRRRRTGKDPFCRRWLQAGSLWSYRIPSGSSGSLQDSRTETGLQPVKRIRTCTCNSGIKRYRNHRYHNRSGTGISERILHNLQLSEPGNLCSSGAWIKPRKRNRCRLNACNWPGCRPCWYRNEMPGWFLWTGNR